MPFSWVETENAKLVWRILRPAVGLPSRKQLSGPLLDRVAADVEAFMAGKLKQVKGIAICLAKRSYVYAYNHTDKRMFINLTGVTLSFDGWNNVKRQDMFGFSASTPDREMISSVPVHGIMLTLFVSFIGLFHHIMLILHVFFLDHM